MTATSGRSRKRRVPGRGALVVIAALMAGSALLRIGDDAGQALARAHDATSEPAPGPTAAGAECANPEQIAPVLEALQQREARLKEREDALADRMHTLRIADREAARRLEALTEAEGRLRETIALADTAAEDDLARLTRVYENMKPQQAAALFEEMDPDFAAGFLGRMRPEAAAGIMAGLSAQAAHTFSVVLAGRNAEVPTE